MSFECKIERVVIPAPELSFVVPFLDERESLLMLHRELCEICEELGQSFEVIFVDDGSRDGGDKVIRNLAEDDARVSLLRLRRNFGKSAALSAGFRAARGAIVFSIDADLQDDPKEVGRFLEKLSQGADCVTGWKQVRNDPLDKTLPSKLFNVAVNRIFGLKLMDHNCGYKAYRREALDELDLYGELHRFIPALLFARGYRIEQIPVEHRARKFGRSKFGAKRIVKGALDLLTVALTTRYGARPLHLFGGGGLLFSLMGFAILTYLSVLWFAGAGPIGSRPLLMLGVLLVLGGGQMIGVGLLAELLLKRTIGEKDKYSIAEKKGPVAQEDPTSPASLHIASPLSL